MLWRLYLREMTGGLFGYESTDNHYNLKHLTLKKMPRRWAVMIERELDQGLVGCVDKSVTLGDLLKRYLKEVTPHKKSRDKETWRIKALLKRSISGVGLNNLTSTIISSYKYFKTC